MRKNGILGFLLLVTFGLAACIVETGPTNGSAWQGTGQPQPQPKVDFDDLRVGDAMRAERELENRGFVAVDGSQSASGFSNLWMFNRRTGQCVQLETSGDKVMTLNEVTHPKCR
jgi:hypothetical protein